ncbi:DNA-binding protein [Macrococcus brunensis]|uniref:DNA-binding protein n=1 Tax=Macrococcus brunensis TaxID=198483 RepID=UPI001EF07FB1|nr:DNA-binding protein [Macrococcus brunensis]ULG71885.1 DNA-binding protein [Macrococcus brunensis]
MLKNVVIGCIASLLLISPEVQAESFKDKAPEIIPAIANGKKVLVDNTHGQTAGAADWVIDGAFSDFGQGLAAKGYQVRELRKGTPIVLSDLQNYDTFVIPEANIPFKATEQAAILSYVKAGGSVFFISDHYNADRNLNRYDSSEVFNGYRRGAYSDPTKGMSAEEKTSTRMTGVTSSDWLNDNFGVRFRYNALNNIITTKVVPETESFGITKNIQSIAMHAGSTIAITKPDIAKGLVYLPDGLTTNDKWGPSVDQGVYFGGGEAEGPYVAISKVGLGKAAFVGDSSMVEDSTPKYKREDNGQSKTTYDGYKEVDDDQLLNNLVDWLTVDESYSTFKEKGLPLDTPSPQLAIENPATSTEPANEPWSTPLAGYKWFDESTFKAGSYGYTTVQQPGASSYDFTYPAITNGTEFVLTLKLTGLAANTTYSNLKTGIYNSSGTQLGSFYMNGTWSPVGYSPAFSVKTDAYGNALFSIRTKTTKGQRGAASIRLKKDTTTLYTETTTIK